MNKYNQLQAEHQRLLEIKDAGASALELLPAVQEYIQRVRSDAAYCPGARDRSQLRANLRFWGAFVFEQTGIYPDTTLQPATMVKDQVKEKNEEDLPKGVETSAEVFTNIAPIKEILESASMQDELQEYAGKPQAVQGLNILLKWKWPLILTAAALVLVIWGAGRVVAALQVPKTPPPVTATPQESTKEATLEVAAMATQTPTPAPVKQSTPTHTALPATQPPSLPTENIPFTATVAALQTQVAHLKQTQAPTSSLLPETGGGDGPDVVDMFAFMRRSSPEICRQRSISLSIDAVPELARLAQPASVQITQAGSGSIVGQSTLSFSGKTQVIPLPLGAAAAVLVQVNSPGFLFDTIILPFGNDCSGALTEIEFSTDINLNVAGPIVNKAQKQAASPIGLDWQLLSWGPSPFADGFASELLLVASNASNANIASVAIRALFWASGSSVENANASGLLPSDRLILRTFACSQEAVLVGISFGGQAASRYLRLAYPECIPDLK